MIAGRIVLYIVRFLLGGSIYYMLENIIRGYSHWTMLVLGGVCFLACGIVNDISGDVINTWEKMVWCMIIITLLEFVSGLVINLSLGWNIWDYSGMPFHIMGQICIPYMLLWYFMSYPALMLNRLCDRIR